MSMSSVNFSILEYVKKLGKMFQHFVCFFCLKKEYLGVNSNLTVQKMVGDFYIFSVFYVRVILTALNVFSKYSTSSITVLGSEH
jgi:hypothetical protein